ncbi:hypothetical protein SK128_014969 [Halocaridina rubra]|uniref:Uncharacterized protein n=1 Tax=Halocaridina rubra TaxID=373956 RepID=A0AAN9A367_HALRR
MNGGTKNSDHLGQEVPEGNVNTGITPEVNKNKNESDYDIYEADYVKEYEDLLVKFGKKENLKNGADSKNK